MAAAPLIHPVTLIRDTPGYYRDEYHRLWMVLCLGFTSDHPIHNTFIAADSGRQEDSAWSRYNCHVVAGGRMLQNTPLVLLPKCDMSPQDVAEIFIFFIQWDRLKLLDNRGTCPDWRGRATSPTDGGPSRSLVWQCLLLGSAVIFR
ncbi:uncharacterized protein LOC110340609 isoform X1 [Mesocricetus auratus]|uniref:Uncharacterized protein LOC110340609 isoform X1 n=1 Tax=Mesocricetus auratus TaxID=10036 RepID=A0A3Q0CMA4_MESAU|nr:uncharacterized protein LOC110340609 isoform X1 [Mesocricetus auratus]